jgi:hypothetical protein
MPTTPAQTSALQALYVMRRLEDLRREQDATQDHGDWRHRTGNDRLHGGRRRNSTRTDPPCAGPQTVVVQPKQATRLTLVCYVP